MTSQAGRVFLAFLGWHSEMIYQEKCSLYRGNLPDVNRRKKIKIKFICQNNNNKNWNIAIGPTFQLRDETEDKENTIFQYRQVNNNSQNSSSTKIK